MQAEERERETATGEGGGEGGGPAPPTTQSNHPGTKLPRGPASRGRGAARSRAATPCAFLGGLAVCRSGLCVRSWGVVINGVHSSTHTGLVLTWDIYDLDDAEYVRHRSTHLEISSVSKPRGWQSHMCMHACSAPADELGVVLGSRRGRRV